MHRIFAVTMYEFMGIFLYKKLFSKSAHNHAIDNWSFQNLSAQYLWLIWTNDMFWQRLLSIGEELVRPIAQAAGLHRDQAYSSGSRASPGPGNNLPGFLSPGLCILFRASYINNHWGLPATHLSPFHVVFVHTVYIERWYSWVYGESLHSQFRSPYSYLWVMKRRLLTTQ